MVITSDKCFIVAVISYVACITAVCIQQKTKKLWEVLAVSVGLVIMIVMGAIAQDAPDLLTYGVEIRWYWLLLDAILLLISVFAIFYSYHLYTIGM